jgi:hypothetical protein
MKKLLPLALLGLASCLTTRVEVETEVLPDGTVQRRLVVTSQDEGRPADHPTMLRPPATGYLVSQVATGHTEAFGSFAAGRPVPPILGFREGTTGLEAPTTAEVRVLDWGLFRQYRYAERIHDVVDPAGIQEAVEETADVLLDNADRSLARLLGPDYERTELHRALDAELGDLGRALALQFWREVAFGDFDEDAALERLVAVLRRAGLPLAPGAVRAAVEEGPGGEAWLALRAAGGDWARERLELLVPREDGRAPSWPDMRALLFDGAFELAFEEEMKARFGGEQGMEAWFEEAYTRIFGLFGGNRATIDFELTVRLPGEPLRTSGYLSGDGAAFVAFPAEEVYPGGAGLSSESVLWEPAVFSALPGFQRLLGNRDAVAWTWICGTGPDGTPDREFVALLKRCALARSWSLLEGEFPEGSEAAARWDRARAWLRGEVD